MAFFWVGSDVEIAGKLLQVVNSNNKTKDLSL